MSDKQQCFNVLYQLIFEKERDFKFLPQFSLRNPLQTPHICLFMVVDISCFFSVVFGYIVRVISGVWNNIYGYDI